MSTSQKSIALITGASSGIGEEFALQLASEPHINEFWLIARRKERLENLAIKIKDKNPHLKIKILVVDLSLPQEIDLHLKNLLVDEKPIIRWCINNAGFGLVGDFEDIDLNKQLEMIDLNVRAATHITGLTIPYMHKGSHLILTASSAGFFPLPTFAVYAATKAFVVHFANALAQELHSKGIHVTAVCPGPVATEFFSVAYAQNSIINPVHQKIAKQKLTLVSAKDVAQLAIKDSKKGNIRSTKGFFTEFAIRLSGIIPRQLLVTSLGKILRKK